MAYGGTRQDLNDHMNVSLEESVFSILDTVTDGYVLVDSSGKCLRINDKALRLLQKAHSIVGDPLWISLPHAEGHYFVDKLEEFKATRNLLAFEWYLASLSLALEVSFVSLHDNIIVSFRNFSEHRRSDEALDKSRKDLADIKFALDESSIVAITDQRGIINYVNDKFCQISKYSREELLGQDHRIINSGYHSKEFIRNLWTTIASGKVWRGEIKNRAKDGSYYWVDTTIVPFLNAEGKPYQYVALRNDITERKLDEERLAEQAALLDHSQDAILVRDLEHNVLFWNKSAERIYGWTAQEALNKSIYDLIYQGRTHELHNADKVLHEKGEWKGEIHQVTKDGRDLIVESTWTLVRDDNGNPKSILITNTDATSKKRLEKQFLRAQRMESIGTLAGGIAHDLNNVLSPILMATHLLQLKI